MKQAYIFGLLATALLLVFYFSVLALVSGWNFASEQFLRYWYFIVSLAVGFGIQIGLYNFLRQGGRKMPVGTVAATGTTSTLSMISCCAHYLVNLLPILGIAGIVTLVSAYQIQLFWVGLIFNLAGIVYMVSNVYKLRTV